MPRYRLTAGPVFNVGEHQAFGGDVSVDMCEGCWTDTVRPALAPVLVLPSLAEKG